MQTVESTKVQRKAPMCVHNKNNQYIETGKEIFIRGITCKQIHFNREHQK